MKYIDADKLIAILERQNVDKKVIQPLIRIIDSLQQEQQENKPNLLKSLKEYLEKTPKEILDADWEKLKVWNEIGPDAETYCKALREQQELEKEIEEYWIATEWSKKITLGKFKVIARYFYGLAQLNSK